MRARRLLAVTLSGTALLTHAWPGAKPLAAQAKFDTPGCPSFHEVHPTMTGMDALQAHVPGGFKIYPSDGEANEQLLLREIPIVSGGEIADAQADIDYRTNAHRRFPLQRCSQKKIRGLHVAQHRTIVRHPYSRIE